MYPIAAMLAALGVIVSPVSKFLVWLGPIAEGGGVTEYVMFGVALAALLALLAV